MGVSVGSEPRVMGQNNGLVIAVSLTDKGVENYKEVMRLIFAHINTLRETSPPEYIFNENKTMS